VPSFGIYGAFPRDQFRDIIASLHPTSPVQWVGDPRVFPGPKNGKPGELLELHVARIRNLGWEDTTRTYDSVLDCQSVLYTGHQVVIVTFRLDSFSFETPAYDTLSRVILKLRRQNTLDALAAIGVAYAKKNDIVPLDLVADNRPIYSAACDVEFNFLVSETDEQDTGTIVETVNGNNVVPDNPPLSPTGK
jgi:hypothetical protein